MAHLAADHLFKVFGRRPHDGVRRLTEGADRDELREEGTTAAVIDASFAVREGEVFVVMGLSGSGKSSLLRMLNGLLEPTSGRVLFDGQDLTALPAKALRDLRSRRISMVFQHFALFPHRTVLDNAGYGLQVQGLPREEREERAAAALESVGLAGWEASWPDQLSGGMRQRVGLARALATDADLLLMDESFSALDPLIRREMQEQLLDIQRRLHKTIVFITHDLNEAMLLGDRIAVMRDGRIVQIGTAEDILTRPADAYVSGFVRDVDRSRVLTAGSIMQEPRVVVSTDDEPRAAMHALSGDDRAAAAFVVGPGRKLVGAVTEERCSAALAGSTATAAGTGGDTGSSADAGSGTGGDPDTGARANTSTPAHTGTGTVGDLVDAHMVALPADTPLADLLTPASRTALPLAVVDDDGRLTGVIPRGTLLAALGDRPTLQAAGDDGVGDYADRSTALRTAGAGTHTDPDHGDVGHGVGGHRGGPVKEAADA